MTTKAELDHHLLGEDRQILAVLPDAPGSSVDEFILQFIHQLAVASIGGEPAAAQARVQLASLRDMPYGEMQIGAAYSPAYADFVRERMAAKEIAVPVDPVTSMSVTVHGVLLDTRQHDVIYPLLMDRMADKNFGQTLDQFEDACAEALAEAGCPVVPEHASAVPARPAAKSSGPRF